MTESKSKKSRVSDAIFLGLLIVTAVSVIGTLQFVFLKVPEEKTMGIVQKIFYFHVPCWYGMYLGAAVCFVGSIGFLVRADHWEKSVRWDAAARAGADVVVAMGLIGLITGPLWAIKAWGKAWTWDPRLTTALLSWLIYVAYVVLRSFTAGGEAERKFAAALGILGAATLPIIHVAVKRWGGQHPNVISGSGGGLSHPDMKAALGYAFLAFTFLTILLVWQRIRLHISQSRVDALEQQAIELGMSGE